MLGIEYYGFALFVAILICLIAVLCKFLFADIKRQNKLLDEKESKLLKLYQSIEDVLDEFSDQSAEARSDIEKLVAGARAYQDDALRVQAEALAAIESAGVEALVEAEREREAGRELEKSRAASKPKTGAKASDEAEPPAPAAKRKPVKSGAGGGVASFQKIIDELEGDAPEPKAPEAAAKPGRNDAILALKAEGKSVQKIAQELGITQNEVKLVIGLNK